MILGSNQDFEMERSSSLSGERQFTFAANAKAFSVLIDRLYSNKEGAVVREVCTNAYDALVMAGRGDTPFTVHMPDSIDPNFRVIDNGVGLGEEDVFRLMSGVFQSDKEKSNATAGAYGLGSKCPFSISDTFTIISRHGGVKRHFMCFKNEEGVPSILKTMEEAIGEGEYPTGVEVVVPVSPSKFARFEEEARKQLFFFNPLPEVEGYTPAEKDKLFGSKGKVTQLTDRMYTMQRHDYPGTPAVIVTVGPVGYPVSWDSILGKDKEIDAQIEFLRKINGIRTNHGNCYVFDMKIGEIDVPPSREMIEFSEKTLMNMRAATKGLREKIRAGFIARMKEPTAPHDMVNRLNEMISELGIDLVNFLGVMDTFREMMPEELRGGLYKDYQNKCHLKLWLKQAWVNVEPVAPPSAAEWMFDAYPKFKVEMFDAYRAKGIEITTGPGTPHALLLPNGLPIPEMAEFALRQEDALMKKRSVHENHIKDLKDRHETFFEDGPNLRFYSYKEQPLGNLGRGFHLLKEKTILDATRPFHTSEGVAAARRDMTKDYHDVFSITQSAAQGVADGSRVFIIKDRADEINLRLMGAMNQLLPNSPTGKMQITLLEAESFHAERNPKEIKACIDTIKRQYKLAYGKEMHPLQFSKLSDFPKGKNPPKEGADVNKVFANGPAAGVTRGGSAVRWEMLNQGKYKGVVFYEREDHRIHAMEKLLIQSPVRISPSVIRKGTVEHLKACGLISLDDFIKGFLRRGLSQADMFYMFINEQVNPNSKGDDRVYTIEHHSFNGLRSTRVDTGNGLLNRYYTHFEQWMRIAEERMKKMGVREFDQPKVGLIRSAFSPQEGTKMHRQLKAIDKAFDVYREFSSSRVMKAYLGARRGVGLESVFNPDNSFKVDFEVFSEQYNKHFPVTQTV